MRLRGRIVVVLIAIVVSSCNTGWMQYRNDHRITITQPRDRSTVSLPFTVRWTYRDFKVTGPTGERDRKAGYFGVFVDRSPMPAGQHLSWLAKDDPSCTKTDGCPDERYLADRNVFTTTEPELVVTTLPTTDVRTATERHEVTVILLDGTGRRIGESAWYVAIDYKRRRAV